MSDLISRQDAIEAIEEITWYREVAEALVNGAIESIPSAEATGALDEATTKYVANGYMLPPSTLTALPSATCDDCIWHVCNYNKIDWEGEDGYISRRDAIRWVKTECNPYGKPTLDFESGKKVIEHLERMPSAEAPTVSEEHQLSEETPTNTPTDLISRQAAIKNAHFPMIDDAGYEVVRVDDILALPSAEPKTGEWIQDDDYICDQCGYHMIVGGGAYNFCPNCGTKMYKDGEDE